MSEIKGVTSAYQLFQREKHAEVKASIEVRWASLDGRSLVQFLDGLLVSLCLLRELHDRRSGKTPETLLRCHQNVFGGSLTQIRRPGYFPFELQQQEAVGARSRYGLAPSSTLIVVP